MSVAFDCLVGGEALRFPLATARADYLAHLKRRHPESAEAIALGTTDLADPRSFSEKYPDATTQEPIR